VVKHFKHHNYIVSCRHRNID